MYKSFEVRNFRGFRQLKIDDWQLINLVAGRNNVGKTALLEALFIHCGAYSPDLARRVDTWRGLQPRTIEIGPAAPSLWYYLFKNFDSVNGAELVGVDTQSGEREIKLRVIEGGEDLADTGDLFQLEREKAEGASSSTIIAPVLEFKYEGGQKQGKSYMTVDSKGQLRITPFPPFSPPFPTIFQGARIQSSPNERADRFTNLLRSGARPMLLDVLRVIEPQLNTVEIHYQGGEPVLWGSIPGVISLPLQAMGDGMVRLTDLVVNIVNAPHGVVLVDEIENGIHHSVLRKVWSAIGKIARQYDTQVTATTHSRECIVAAHQAFSESEDYNFRLHRLDAIKGHVEVVTYEQEALQAAIEMGLEVR